MPNYFVAMRFKLLFTFRFQHTFGALHFDLKAAKTNIAQLSAPII